MKNDTFSISRFYHYFRSQTMVSWKYWVIGAVSLFGLLAIVDFFIIDSAETTYHDYFGEGIDFVEPIVSKSQIQLVFFAGLIIVWLSLMATSFVEFRRKEQSFTFMMLPASTSEKFWLELIRAYLPILFYPVVFWAAFEFTMMVKTSIFSYLQPWHLRDHLRLLNMENYRHIRLLSESAPFTALGIVLAQVAFIGAIAFKEKFAGKVLAIIIGMSLLYFALVWVFMEKLDYDQYHLPTHNLLHFKNLNAWKFYFSACVVLVVGLKTAAFFKLKEKEV